MKTFDIYGFKESEISTVKAVLEKTCLVSFHEHESEFSGIYYLANLDGGEIYKLYMNQIGEDFHEEGHKNFPVLLNIDYPVDPNFFIRMSRENKLGATPLYRREIGEGIAKSYRFENDKAILIAEKALS